MPLGNGYKNNVLDAIFGSGFTKPANVYVALLSSAITAPDGTGGVELTGSGYARAAIVNNSTNFGPAASSQLFNKTVINYPTVIGTNWLPIVGFAIYDDATSTAAVNLIGYNVLGTPRTYSVGQTPTFPIGSLVVSV